MAAGCGRGDAVMMVKLANLRSATLDVAVGSRAAQAGPGGTVAVGGDGAGAERAAAGWGDRRIRGHARSAGGAGTAGRAGGGGSPFGAGSAWAAAGWAAAGTGGDGGGGAARRRVGHMATDPLQQAVVRGPGWSGDDARGRAASWRGAAERSGRDHQHALHRRLQRPGRPEPGGHLLLWRRAVRGGPRGWTRWLAVAMLGLGLALLAGTGSRGALAGWRSAQARSG